MMIRYCYFDITAQMKSATLPALDGLIYTDMLETYIRK